MEPNNTKNVTETEKEREKRLVDKLMTPRPLVATDHILALWKLGQVSDAKFRTATGKTPVEALKLRRVLDRLEADIHVQTLVELGRLTPKDYENIVGKPYMPGKSPEGENMEV